MIHELGELRGSDGHMLLKMWEAQAPAGLRPLIRHSHICFEISLIVEGDGLYQVGDETYAIRPGGMFVYASNEPHCITRVGEEGLTLINLHFEPRYLWGRSFDSLSSQNANFCFRHARDFRNGIPPEQAGPLRELFRRMADELREKRPEYALQVKSLLNGMILELIRHQGYSADARSVSQDKYRLIRQTAAYIDAHFAEKLTLAMLAGLSGMTPNYFSALFHQVSGISLWDYINARRIEAALQLLKGDKGLNILEIAQRCGYNNTANFNKIFKKTTGVTPSEYRLGGDLLV